MLPKGKVTWKDFEEHARSIEKATTVIVAESPAEKAARIERLLGDYNAFFKYYYPHYAKSDCAPWHIKLGNQVLNEPTFKGIVEGHRGSAKSTHVDIGIPSWLKQHKQTKCVVIVGETVEKAVRLLASIQAEFKHNQRIKEDFGDQYTHGSWDAQSFITRDGTAFFAIGLGQDPSGLRHGENRPDLIICDDLDNKRRNRNTRLVREAVEWIQDELMGCFDIGWERFIMVNSTKGKVSILEYMKRIMVFGQRLDEENTEEDEEIESGESEEEPADTREKWHYYRIPAIDEATGLPTWPQKYTLQYWLHKKNSITSRSWNMNYACVIVVEGKIFKEQWVTWGKIPDWDKLDHIVCYCDPSFKGESTNDFKAIKLWGKAGTRLYLIKAFVRQCSVSAMVRFFYDLHESLPEKAIVDYYMEASFIQDILLDEFEAEGEIRNYQLPIRGDTRAKPNKFQRIEAMQPLYERGIITYNEDEKNSTDMQRAVEHLLAFEEGSATADDSPDADEGAIWILQKRTRVHTLGVRIGRRIRRGKF